MSEIVRPFTWNEPTAPSQHYYHPLNSTKEPLPSSFLNTWAFSF